MRATRHGEAYGTQELHPPHPPRPASNPPRQPPADDPQWDKKNMSRSKTSRSHVADGDGCMRGYIDESAREAALLCICTRTYRSAHIFRHLFTETRSKSHALTGTDAHRILLCTTVRCTSCADVFRASLCALTSLRQMTRTCRGAAHSCSPMHPFPHTNNAVGGKMTLALPAKEEGSRNGLFSSGANLRKIVAQRLPLKMRASFFPAYSMIVDS